MYLKECSNISSSNTRIVSRAGLKAFNPFKAEPSKLMSNLMNAYIKRPSRGEVKIGEDVVTPISKSYPPTGSGMYTVKQGDTLESIAQAEYGDVNDADAIGSSCGVSDGSIAPGQVLMLPQLMPMQFQSGNAPAYDRFKQTILNNLYPYLKLRQPSEGPWWSEAIHIIVDTAAAIIGYAVYGPIGAAVFTAIADAAYQEAAVDVGWQDHWLCRNFFCPTTKIVIVLSLYIVMPLMHKIAQMQVHFLHSYAAFFQHSIKFYTCNRRLC